MADITRRTLLMAAALTAGVSTNLGGDGPLITSEATEGEHADAALLAAWAGYVSAFQAFDQAVEAMPGGGTDEDHEPFSQKIDIYRDQIETLTASTMDGFVVQLRYLIAEKEGCSDTFNAAVYGEPLTAELIGNLDNLDRMLWRMVQAATQASRGNALAEIA